MKNRISIICVFGMLVLSISGLKAQTDVRMQSVFIYNFTRLMAWPSEYQQGEFIIGVLGSTPMLAEIEEMAKTKKAGSQTIVAAKFEDLGSIGKCHILYIPASQSRKIVDVVAELKSKNIKALIITDSRNATTSGSVINFTVVENRQRFELSEKNAEQMGLKPGTEIARLAIITD